MDVYAIIQNLRLFTDTNNAQQPADYAAIRVLGRQFLDTVQACI